MLLGSRRRTKPVSLTARRGRLETKPIYSSSNCRQKWQVIEPVALVEQLRSYWLAIRVFKGVEPNTSTLELQSYKRLVNTL